MNFETWQATGKYFFYKGQRIFFQESKKANAENLILIHGFPTASWDWHKMWAVLKEKFNILAPDMIGFGFSDKPKQYAYSIMDQADLHETMFQKMNIRKAHILAHDYGDTVAQELLARHLDRQEKRDDSFQIQSLCFLNGGLFPETHQARPVQKMLISPVGFLLSRLMNKQTMEKSFRNVFGAQTQPTQQEFDEFWALIQHDNGQRIMHLLIRYMTDRRTYRERWVSAMQNSDIALRVIDGPVDPVSGVHMTERYKELIPNPDVILLEGIGHYPNVEAPDLVLKHYLEFVEK